MMIRRWNILALAVLLTLAGSAIAVAQEGGGDDESAMTEAWLAASTPGEHHKHMAKAVGDWNFEGKFWMAPDAPPVESNGTATFTSILGGRYIQMTADSMFMGRPFQGMGIDGYDNMKQKHIGTWIDTAGTMIVSAEGTCEDGGRVTTTWSEFTDPTTGELKKLKNVLTVVDANTMTYESFEGDRKSMAVTYKRK